MTVQDIRFDVVKAVLEQLRGRFDTYAVARHPDFVDGHDPSPSLPSRTGKFLRAHSADLGIELVDGSRSPAVWRRSLDPAPRSEPVRPRLGSGPHPVRTGHWEAVRLLAAQGRELLAPFQESQVVGGVFVRCSERGACVIDLHPDSPKPLVGVGTDPYLTRRTRLPELRSSLPAREAHLLAVRAQQRAHSREARFEAELLRHAVVHGLRLPVPFPDSLRLFAHQWRLQGEGTARLDLLCVDLDDQAAVVVELKPDPDLSAEDQARGYAEALRADAARLGPFMTAYLRAMAGCFGADELREQTVDLTATRAAVCWPGHYAEVDVDDATAAGPRLDRGLGPQYAGDAPFTARMRKHQSWWRDRVLEVPYGRGPRASSTTRYGNMLDDDGADRLLNLLTDDVRRVYLEREGTGVEPFRARRNLLSSQPMCFNLFGQLAADHDLATRVLAALLPDVERVLDVRLEWAPAPVSRYLGDRTSFDAVVEYATGDGRVALLGVETKLTEPFSPEVYDRPRYRELTEQEGSPWPRRSWQALADTRWNQLWRNHLLVEAYRNDPGSGITGPGRLAVVHHPGDMECAEALRGYTRLVREDTVLDLPLDRLDAVITPVLRTESERSWWAAFRRRYIDLSGSEHVR